MIASNPLSTRNRTQYAPPKRPLQSEITFDLLSSDNEETEPEESPRSESPQKFSKDAIYTLISTTYSLLVLAFFKSIIEKVKRKPATEKTEESSEPEVVTESEPLRSEPQIIEQPVVSLSPLRYSQVRNPNPYESLFLLESDEDIDDSVQYGTSLAISKNSFKPRIREEEHAQHILQSTTILNNRFLESGLFNDNDNVASDFFSISKPSDEYDAAVSKFYQPFKPLPQTRQSLTETLLASFPLVTSILREEQRKIQSLITKERLTVLTAIPPLDKDKLEVVQKYWRSRDASINVVSAYSIDLTVRDLATLADGQWLNDNVIDFYLSLVTDQCQLVYCWTTHFFSTLKQKGYQGVARWAKRRKINVFEKDRIIVPINIMSTHWALAVVDNKRQEIKYFDSLASKGNVAAVQLLLLYMSKEAERLQLPQVAYDLIPGAKTPQQQNGYDCGVFTCTVAKFISRDQPLVFGQQDMKNIRRRMAFEIILQSLLDNPLNPTAHL